MSEFQITILSGVILGTVVGIWNSIVDYRKKHPRKRRIKYKSKYRISDVAYGGIKFTGIDYEYYVAGQLRELGYSHIKMTKETGDYGADIIARKKRKLYVFQCKYYSKSVGVSAVQEVLGAMGYYEADEGIVVTNSYFTKAAISLAKSNDIKLWDNFY